ncbi:hypothetical protein [Paenibacillus xylanexedens]|uniref:Uncharacterized protein n=1 Tax=Paenibacillus xylanexedens TaxID=528191 RepID=A0ABS4RN56_PAEXY|nr:hypothetical protein [Paenibacillus xylanexedens]MBP2244311.1 hypothetical protein [Paenibacillus xylanexedens]
MSNKTEDAAYADDVEMKSSHEKSGAYELNENNENENNEIEAHHQMNESDVSDDPKQAISLATVWPVIFRWMKPYGLAVAILFIFIAADASLIGD